MGRGHSKIFFKMKRKKYKKRKRARLKEKYGEYWNQPHFRHVKPYIKAQEEGISTREDGKEKDLFHTDSDYGGLDYITIENTKTKKGRIPQIVNEEDIPSYLLNHCLKMKKQGLESDYCRSECPLGADCEGTPGNISYPVTHIVKGFKALYPDKEVKMSAIGITL